MFNGAVNFEDVVQEGNVALFVKLKELLGTKQAVDVEEELSDSISSAMKSYISEITGEEDGEETIAGKANLVNEAVKYLEEHNGTTPDKNEIAEFTHLTMEELSDIMDIMKRLKRRENNIETLSCTYGGSHRIYIQKCLQQIFWRCRQIFYTVYCKQKT